MLFMHGVCVCVCLPCAIGWRPFPYATWDVLASLPSEYPFFLVSCVAGLEEWSHLRSSKGFGGISILGKGGSTVRRLT